MKKYIIPILLILSVGCKPWNGDCDYTVPSAWKLMRNSKGEYAIGLDSVHILCWSRRYPSFSIGAPGGNGSTIDRFDDSCEAKGFIKYHFQHDSFNIFK